MRGEVVGINSQIYSRSGSFIGISFAIPIDEAIRVADQLRASGRVIRGRIGVQIDQVTKDVAESIGLGKPSGALVRSVEAGGPADRAGVEAGDIITKFDGRTIDKAGDLPRIVGSAKPGTKATLEVFRRGASKELNVTVVELEAERSNRSPPVERNAPKLPAVISLLGLAVSDLSAAQKSEFKVKNGVRVEAIEGAAAKAGIREGDIVLSLDKTEITSVKQFEAAIGKLDKPKSVTLLVKRGEWVNYIVIRPPR
jgi:serine protease Do